MLSIPDMALLGAAALLLFGPEQLPRVARKAGNVMREIQNTSQSFIRELERAADVQDDAGAPPPYVPPYEPYEPAYDPTAGEATFAASASEYAYVPPPADAAFEPPAPPPERPAAAPRRPAPASAPVGERLGEPRPAPGLADHDVSEAAEAAPEADHPTHV